jgi:hypothetical protein
VGFVACSLGVVKASTSHFSMTGATVNGVWERSGVMPC